MLSHASFEANRESLVAKGVDVAFSKGACRRVWFHKPFLRKWAVKHVCKRHKGKPSDVIVLCVQIPDSWLKKYRDGVYYCERTVPPAHIMSIDAAL